jgi:hypothetical protein
VYERHSRGRTRPPISAPICACSHSIMIEMKWVSSQLFGFFPKMAS